MPGTLTEDEVDRLEKFLAGPWVAVLATIGTDGVPLLTPISYNYSDGRITISSRKDTAKFRNLTRDGRVALTVCSEPRAEDYVTVWGRAETMDGDAIWPPTRAIAERYVALGVDVPAGFEKIDEYIAELKKQDRAIISVQPTRLRFRLPMPVTE